MSELPIPRTAEAVDFLQHMQPGGPWHLVAINPDSGKVEGASFTIGDVSQMPPWIDARQGKDNLYFHVNRLRTGFKGPKAKKEDVAEATHLHTDVDNTADDTPILQFDPPPTATLFSGGGFQSFWRLKTPTADHARVEASNLAIASRLGGDNCHNIDRIMRLPGTINMPNAKKRANGRVPTLARLVFADWSRVYDLDAFPLEKLPDEKKVGAAAGSVIVPLGIEGLPDGVTEEVRSIIRIGDDLARPRTEPGKRFKSRSEAVFVVAVALAKAGFSGEKIAGVLINPSFGISASILEKKKPVAYALRQARAAIASVSSGWPDPDSKGNPRPSMRNTVAALRRMDLTFVQDTFRHRKTINGHALQEFQGEASDDSIAMLRSLIIEAHGFDPQSRNVYDAVTQLCLENVAHPICDMLDELVWDGIPRLDYWLTTYLGAENTPLNAAIGRIMLIAAVRRVRQPGVKFDQIVIFEGPQGSGKSTALSILAGPGNHSDQELLTLDAKTQMELMEGVWIYELGEVEGLNKAEVNKIKAFASRQIDRGRMAYGRFRDNRPRQAIFVGTTNEQRYLRDQTGNRRFWPVRTSTIDLVALRQDRDQLLAEASQREARGESIVLPEELWQAAAEEQADRLEDDPWLERLATVRGTLHGEAYRISTSEIMTYPLELPIGSQNQGYSKRIALLMPKFGWRPAKFKVGGQTVRGYERPKDLDPGDEAFPKRLTQI